ncbi:substrate-binding domain-containing protein [Streptomyces sp. ISL-22]|nr:substrate-binding domain-containing protein [Streptomyces sp. ISL-24]MBT2438436.1 substrate-binding domain-containing protein [Streptomyces sp. ISL-22]
MVRHAPAALRVVLASRHEPDLPLHKMRAAGELTEVRGHDLAFTDAEIDQLFTMAAVGLTPDQVAKVRRVSGGWAMGLRLAAVTRSEEDCRTAPPAADPSPHAETEPEPNEALLVVTVNRGGAEGADAPTAVYTHSDEVALGAIRTLRRAGLRIPEDISVIAMWRVADLTRACLAQDRAQVAACLAGLGTDRVERVLAWLILNHDELFDELREPSMAVREVDAVAALAPLESDFALMRSYTAHGHASPIWAVLQVISIG